MTVRENDGWMEYRGRLLVFIEIEIDD